MKDGAWPPRDENGDKISFTMFRGHGSVRIPCYINVDGAFPLSTHSIKPYPSSRMDLRARLFNKVHSKARQLIEQAWAMLVNRFRRLKGRIELTGKGWATRIISIITACIVLHNICIDHADFSSSAFSL